MLTRREARYFWVWKRKDMPDEWFTAQDRDEDGVLSWWEWAESKGSRPPPRSSGSTSSTSDDDDDDAVEHEEL